MTAGAPAGIAMGFDSEAFGKFLEERSDPAWLTERRRSAFEAFEALPMPSRNEEEWRRTDIRGLKLDQFAPPAAAFGPSSRPAAAADQRVLDKRREELARTYSAGLVRLDGAAIGPARIDLPGGAVLIDLALAARELPHIVERRLMSVVGEPYPDKFAALHGAFWSSGALLHVPKGVKLEAPLFHLIGATGAVAELSHTLVVLEDDAEATFVQESESVGETAAQALHCGAVELIVGPRAKLRFVNIQNWGPETRHFSRDRATVAQGGDLQWTVGAIGSRLAKVNQEVALEGEGARAQVNGVMFTTGKQHLAYFTRQDHAARNTTSDLLYKGGLMDHSRIVWKGMIRVEKGAQKTDAYQKNDNLVLSEHARADSIPGLEIEANDVRCTHGATAGRVDRDMIFYARSRGIKHDEAVRLIVEGFFADVSDRIAVEPARETLTRAVARRLENGTA